MHLDNGKMDIALGKQKTTVNERKLTWSVSKPCRCLLEVLVLESLARVGVAGALATLTQLRTDSLPSSVSSLVVLLRLRRLKQI